MDTKKKIHFKEIDIMRGIAIILVVIGHASPYPQIGMNPNWFQVIYKFIYLFHMPLFFLISGFCFYDSYQGAKTWNVKSVIFLKKVKHLAVPYFFYSFTTLILKLLFAKYANNPFYIKDFYKIFLGQNPNGGLWFLWILLVMFTIALLINRMNIYILLIITLILKLGTAMWSISNNLLQQLSVYSVFFVAGLLLHHKYEWFKKLKLNLTLLSVILCAFAFGLSMWQGKPMILVVIGGLCAIWAIWILAMKITENNGCYKTLLTAAEYSMDIYLLSYFVQVPIRIVTTQFVTLPYIVVLLLMCLLGGIIPVYISKYVIRKNKWTSIVLLGRIK